MRQTAARGSNPPKPAAPVVRKAVIPAGGKGTRLLPATLAVPKELLPVGGVPMIHHAAAEAWRSGIREIIVVIAPGKEAIRRYLAEAPLGAPAAGHSLQAAVMDELARMREETAFRFVVQDEPRGLADAVCRCREDVGGESFALLLPDNIYQESVPVTKRLLACHRRHGLDTIGLTRVDTRRAPLLGNCGSVRCEPLPGGNRQFRITALQDKGPGQFAIETALSPYRTTPRHILLPHFFDYADDARRTGGDGELDDVPIFQRIIRERGMVGALIDSADMDAGNPAGYADANERLAGKAGA